jgi:hypothetical protein
MQAFQLMISPSKHMRCPLLDGNRRAHNVRVLKTVFRSLILSVSQKEEKDKAQKILDQTIKLPDNRVCADCHTLGRCIILCEACSIAASHIRFQLFAMQIKLEKMTHFPLQVLDGLP